MVLSICAALAQKLGSSTTVGRLLGAPVTAMGLALGLASCRILPAGGTMASKSLQKLCLQLATPSILLGADVRQAARQGGPLLLSFAVAALATLGAARVAWSVAGNGLTTALGTDGAKIAAALLAKNVGGGINYMAVCQTLKVSPTAVAAGLCVDNVFALIYFPVTSALASRYEDMEESVVDDKPVSSPPPPDDWIYNLSTVLALSFSLLWLSERLAGAAWSLPVCTALTVALASIANLQPLQAASNALGMVCLYLFFATAGAPGIAVATSVRASIVPLSLFLTLLYSIHGAVLWIASRKKSAWTAPQRLLVASSASIGGPATAVALAGSWPSLQVPALLVGNVGYAVATFLAILYHVAITRV